MLRSLGRYLFRVLVAVDQLGNTLAGGDPDETISSRVGKRVVSDRATAPERWLAWALGVVDPGHVVDAIEEDEGDRDWRT